jgi:hypothetical protein
MKPTSFKETNHVFGAGNNPNTDQCPVSISIHPDNKGIPSVISKWKLSDEELEEINRTGSIYHIVLGMNMTPVSLSVFNPFEENIGYKPFKIK